MLLLLLRCAVSPPPALLAEQPPPSDDMVEYVEQPPPPLLCSVLPAGVPFVAASAFADVLVVVIIDIDDAAEDDKVAVDANRPLKLLRLNTSRLSAWGRETVLEALWREPRVCVCVCDLIDNILSGQATSQLLAACWHLASN